MIEAKPFETAKPGYLNTDGRSTQAVMVVGETQRRYRIKAVMRTKMPGRARWLYIGETALVPKYSVSFVV